MKAKIFSHEKLIGTTALLVGDESMGCLYGEFLPAENYYKYVQNTFWEFWSTKNPNYPKLQALNLNAQLENGYFLFPIGGITIDDIKELPEEPKRIDIAGVNSHVIEDFFNEKEPRPFVVEPWESISIEQKIAFEAELGKEIGITGSNKSILSFLKTNSANHILTGSECVALCHHRGNDDVLFAIKKSGLAEQFAIIHLTWRGDKEVPGYPNFELYSDFDDFKYRRMYPDKADYEY